jgi:hypothetical protein
MLRRRDEGHARGVLVAAINAWVPLVEILR